MSFPDALRAALYRQQLLCLRQLNRLPHLSLTKRITHQQQSTRQRELWNRLLHDLGRRQDMDIRRLSDFIQGLKEKQPPTGEKQAYGISPLCLRQSLAAEKQSRQKKYILSRTMRPIGNSCILFPVGHLLYMRKRHPYILIQALYRIPNRAEAPNLSVFIGNGKKCHN